MDFNFLIESEETLANIAVKQAEAEMFNVVVSTAKQIRSEYLRDKTLKSIHDKVPTRLKKYNNELQNN